MEDTFTIPVSFDEFVIWLNGHTRRTNVLPAQVMLWEGRTSATVTAHGAQFIFYLEEDTDARTTLRASLWSGNEPTPAARQWYADTLQAIRQKWPQRTKKKPGRHKMKCNAWAEEQAREGRTVAEVFEEWRRRYREENGGDPESAADEGLANPRAYLTEVMQRAQK